MHISLLPNNTTWPTVSQEKQSEGDTFPKHITLVLAKFTQTIDESWLTLTWQKSASAEAQAYWVTSIQRNGSGDAICRIISGFPSVPASWTTRKPFVCLRISLSSNALPQLLINGWSRPLGSFSDTGQVSEMKECCEYYLAPRQSLYSIY